MAVCLLLVGAAVVGAATGTMATVAGTGSAGFSGDGGPASAAQLNLPVAVVGTPDGGYLIADQANNRVRRVSPDGTISTVAGSGPASYTGDNGPATSATLNAPSGVAQLADGSVLIADSNNNAVRRVAPDGTITTDAGTGAASFGGDGGPATAAQIRFPYDVVPLPDGGYLIADQDNNRIRRVAPNGTISTVAGSATQGSGGDGGPATSAELSDPDGIALLPDGGYVIADLSNDRVRRVAPDGTITTFAGTVAGFDGDGGPATAAKLDHPIHVAALADGSVLIADRFNNRIRKVDPSGVITTIAGDGTAASSGDGQAATAAQINNATGVGVATDGDVLIADTFGHRIRRADLGDPPTPPTPPASPDPIPAGGVDFTWFPHTPALIAGAPVGGVQFATPALNGATYAWDFDYNPALGFRPTASGAAPRHGFTADGAHDGGRFDGATGERRRLYTVRLRVTAADGTVAESSRELVVVPNNPPLVDFQIDRADQVDSHKVTFTPHVSDPDATARTGDAIDHLEWDFDTPSATGASSTVLICNANNQNCRDASTGGIPGPWLTSGPENAIGVNFFDRALAAHGQYSLGNLDVDALPRNNSIATNGATAVKFLPNVTHFYYRDPRVAFLYDNATMLQQSSFNTDAGEATGASLAAGALRAQRGRHAKTRVAPVAVPSTKLRWRNVKLTAVDSAGARTSTTHVVPLVPDTAPKLQAQFVNKDPAAQPGTRRINVISGHAAGDTKHIAYPLTTTTPLAYDASATSDPDGKIAYYTLEAGLPVQTLVNCIATPKPPLAVQPPPPTAPPVGQPDPLLVFPAANVLGTDLALPAGRLGDLSLPDLKVKPVFGFGRQAPQASSVPPSYASLLSSQPYVHPCIPYALRNVVPIPITWLARPGAPTVNAIVTRDPADLKFELPKGDWSVTIAAYDNSGLGAIQRTDGFHIVEGTPQKCINVSGLEVHAGGKQLGVAGQCADTTAGRADLWTDGDVSVNGVVFRPDSGGHIVVDHTKGLSVTKNTEPDLSGTAAAGLAKLQAAAKTNNAGASILIDGEKIAHVDTLTTDTFRDVISDPSRLNPLDKATYHGSPIVSPGGVRCPDAFCVQFDGSDGTSQTSFRVVLPKEFSRTSPDTSPTAQVERAGHQDINGTDLDTNGFADIARHRRHAKAKAALNLATSIDLSGTDLGPVFIDSGKLEFDTGRGLWRGDIDEAHIHITEPASEASLHLLIDHGELKSASGSVSTRIPLFAGVDLTNLRFGLVTDPLTVKGGATFKALEVISGDLDLLVRPDPFLIRLDGAISIENLIKLGSAYVQYDAANHNNVTFGGKLGIDLGPVSAQGIIDGGVSGETGDFFVQGAVKVCVEICVSGGAILTNEALAACASIDLVFTDVAAGFAYHFPPGGITDIAGAISRLPKGLELFTGCDLNRFRPAVFKTRAGPSLDPRAATTSGYDVPADTEQAAFRFRGNPGQAVAPQVTLIAPDGRTYTSASNGGDYVFAPPTAVTAANGKGTHQAGSAIIDEDPVDKVTTFLVAKPAAGNWKIVLGPGQPPLDGTDFAVGEHLTTSDVDSNVVDADPLKNGARIGVTKFDNLNPPRSGVKIAPLRDESATAKIEDARQRGTLVDVPDGLDGTMTIVDTGPTTNQTITQIDLAKKGGMKVPVVFTPTDDPGPHQLKAILTHADNTPRSDLVIDSFTAPAIPKAPAPKLSVRRQGRDAVVLFNTGEAGSLSSPATDFDLVLATSSGQRVERLIDAGDAKKVAPGKYQVRIGDVDRNASVHLFGRVVYAGREGRVGSDTLKALAKH